MTRKDVVSLQFISKECNQYKVGYNIVVRKRQGIL